MPAWFEWNNYSTTRGFYEQPDNTIEAVFVGNSLGMCALSPIVMYDEQGICAYNLSTEQQSPLMSYYWIKEANRLHGDSLRAVVLEVNELRKAPDYSYTQKALIPMRLSEVKLEAARDVSNMGDGHSYLENLFPLLSFHSRWSSLDWSDWAKNGADTTSYNRGYMFYARRAFERYGADEIDIPLQTITSTERENTLSEDSLLYLDKIVAFCKSRDIHLTLLKTPASAGWTEALHNELQAYADDHNLEFLDMNIDPLITEIDYQPPIDTLDRGHLNYSGASKVSAWIARYLREQCGCMDNRNLSRYSFLAEDSRAWHDRYDGLFNATKYDNEITTYLRDVCKSGYTVAIICRDDASWSLSEDQRNEFRQLGLTTLSEIGFRDSYLAVVSDGKVITEEHNADPLIGSIEQDSAGSIGSTELTSSDDEEEEEEEEEISADPINVDYLLPDNRLIHLASGGKNSGNIASYMLEDTEYAQNKRGINVVVYDNISHAVVDSTCFDTYQSEQRVEPDLYNVLELAKTEGIIYDELPAEIQALYRYQLRYEWQFEIKRASIEHDQAPLATHLSTFLSKPGLEVAILSSGNTSNLLDEDERILLKDMGFVELAKIEKRQPYCCLIEADGSISETTSDKEDAVRFESDLCRMTSNGRNPSGSHVWLAAIGSSPISTGRSAGFYVVAYDPVSLSIVDRRWF